ESRPLRRHWSGANVRRMAVRAALPLAGDGGPTKRWRREQASGPGHVGFHVPCLGLRSGASLRRRRGVREGRSGAGGGSMGCSGWMSGLVVGLLLLLGGCDDRTRATTADGLPGVEPAVIDFGRRPLFEGEVRE